MTTLTPARIETRSGRRWWVCPRCPRTLAELTGGKLVVKIGDRMIILPIVVGTAQVCPRCGCESELEMAA